MKKLSNILESLWTDIQRRSAGDTVRKEDDVDFLDPDSFVAYIRKNYRIDNTPYDIENRTNTGTEVPNIFIPICSAGTRNIKLGAIYFNYNDNRVYTHSSIKKYIPELWAKLNQDFNLLDGNGLTYINPKDTSRKINNSYVLELLNYICDNLDDTVKSCISRKTNESLWTDIQSRSAGDTVRKENDVNLLDRDGLYDYLTSHYKNTNSFAPIYNSETFNTIKVPFLIQGGSDGVYLSFDENEVSIPYSSPYKVKGLFSKLADEFSLKSDAKTEHTWYIISPKDGSEVTNTFFIDVIDFLIDNIPDSFEKGVKKIVNESIWTDIQSRSAGDTVRKEDDVNNLDCEGLTDYLKKHYKPLNSLAIITNVANIISMPIIKITTHHCIMYSQKSKFGKICIADEIIDSVDGLLEKLNTYFEIKEVYGEDTNGEYTLYYVSPKDGSDVTNKFFIEVLDFLLDNIPNSPNYKKSFEKNHK